MCESSGWSRRLESEGSAHNEQRDRHALLRPKLEGRVLPKQRGTKTTRKGFEPRSSQVTGLRRERGLSWEFVQGIYSGEIIRETFKVS